MEIDLKTALALYDEAEKFEKTGISEHGRLSSLAVTIYGEATGIALHETASDVYRFLSGELVKRIAKEDAEKSPIVWSGGNDYSIGKINGKEKYTISRSGGRNWVASLWTDPDDYEPLATRCTLREAQAAVEAYHAKS